MENIEQDIHIYSEQVKDVLTTPPKSIYRWGSTILFFFFMLILILLYVVKYPDIIVGQAVLTTTVPPQKEYARVTGKLEDIFVTNNQKVIENQHLGLIENTANYKDVIYLKSIIDTIKTNQDSFEFPLKKVPLLFLGEIDKAFSAFENDYLQYILNKRSNAFFYENKTNSYTINELRRRLISAEKKKKTNKEELLFKKKDIDRTQKLYNKGVISAQNYEQKKLEYLNAKRNFSDVEIAISQIKETINNAKNIKKQSKVENDRKEINLLKKAIQSYNQLKKAIIDWEQKYLFVSKIKGTVSFINVWSKNQLVTTNDFVFTIIPDNFNEYICKVQVPTKNAGKLRIGQSVNIRLSNYPDYEFGVLKGKLSKVSSIPSEKNMYLLDVSLPKDLKTTYNKQIKFNQEMQGVAEVITEDLRLIDRVFYRFRKIFNRT